MIFRVVFRCARDMDSGVFVSGRLRTQDHRHSVGTEEEDMHLSWIRLMRSSWFATGMWSRACLGLILWQMGCRLRPASRAVQQLLQVIQPSPSQGESSSRIFDWVSKMVHRLKLPDPLKWRNPAHPRQLLTCSR